jgi:thiamine pyrophosphate-dependent acetolactate synthase large subunit-like protein
MQGETVTVTGAQLIAQALKQQDVETFFFIMGAPMLAAEKASIDIGIRGIDVRHEQAAAMMAHAYSRVSSKIGVCMACSGPGTLNFGTGLANALIDCAPVLALGGSAEEMIDSIRAQHVLNGLRGAPPVDRAGLAALIVKVAELAIAHPEIAEIDLDPVIVVRDDYAIVDARMVLACANDDDLAKAG